MIELTWNVFCMTGSIDAYLLYKEMERKAENENKTSLPRDLPDERQAK
ncbi:MAG: YqzL family protein [Sporolactobacillus sp.]|jgi:hypothetical protein|nr:YqzL family protein [Sporolactobacillus sp.]MCI1881531.1 YqzL family protein [Sporolactobacillus sp.]